MGVQTVTIKTCDRCGKTRDLADAVSRAIQARTPDSCRKCGAKRGESCRSDWTTCEGAAHLSGVSASDGKSFNREPPTREHLAGLLAALYYGQYNTNEDKKNLDRNILRALRNFDIGIGEFVSSEGDSMHNQTGTSKPAPSDDRD